MFQSFSSMKTLLIKPRLGPGVQLNTKSCRDRQELGVGSLGCAPSGVQGQRPWSGGVAPRKMKASIKSITNFCAFWYIVLDLCKLYVLYKNSHKHTWPKSEMRQVAYWFMKFMNRCLTLRQPIFFIYKLLQWSPHPVHASLVSAEIVNHWFPIGRGMQMRLLGGTLRACGSQCDSSYGFSVIVRATVAGFIIFQLQWQLKLTNKMFFSYSYRYTFS